MAWYKKGVCAYPYLSRLHNFLTRKLDRKYKPFSVTLPTQVPPGYLVGTSARDLRLYLAVSPAVPSFIHPAVLAVPKWGPKPSPSQRMRRQRPGKLRSKHIRPRISLHFLGPLVTA